MPEWVDFFFRFQERGEVEERRIPNWSRKYMYICMFSDSVNAGSRWRQMLANGFCENEHKPTVRLRRKQSNVIQPCRICAHGNALKYLHTSAVEADVVGRTTVTHACTSSNAENKQERKYITTAKCTSFKRETSKSFLNTEMYVYSWRRRMKRPQFSNT